MFHPPTLIASEPGKSQQRQDEPDLARRHAEWDRQIESLDQTEMELHQTHLRLLRDQTATFIRDLNSLREEVARLRQSHEARHRELLEGADKDKKERLVAHGLLQEKVAGLVGELPREFDRKVSEVHETQQGAHEQLRKDVHERLAQHEADRDVAHNKMKEIVSQHAEALSKAHSGMQQDRSKHDGHIGSLADRLDRLEKEVRGSKKDGRVESLEANVRDLQQVFGSGQQTAESANKTLADHAQRLESHRASVQERLNYLEKLIGDSSTLGRSMQPQAARGKLDMSHGAVQQPPAHLASLVDRVQLLESALKDSAAKHEKDITGTKAKMDQLHGNLSGHHAQLAQQSQERLEALEKTVQASQDNHGGELAAAHAKLEQLHSRVSACEKHAPELADLKKSHSSLAVDSAAKHAHYATVAERLDYLEATLGDSANKHAAELEALKASHAKLDSEHSKHAKDVQAMKSGQTHHATMAERVNILERQVGELDGRHDEDVGGAHGKIDQLHRRLAACESATTTLGELKKAHTTLAADKAALESHGIALKDRVDSLEGALHEHTNKHSKELESVNVKVENVHGRLGACERTGATVADLHKSHSNLAGEKATLDAHHASLQERVDFLERMFGDSADKHAKEIESLKVAHAKHAEEVKGVKSVQTQHASVDDRLKFLERMIGDSADAHAQEVAAAHAKVDQMTARVAACERSGNTIGEIRRAHTGLAAEKATLESSHASLKERVDYLETILHDSAEKHTRALEEAKARMDHVHARLTTCEKHGSSVADLGRQHDDHKRKADTHQTAVKDKLEQLEASHSDRAEKHSKEVDTLKAAHAKLASDAKAHQAKVSEVLQQGKEARDAHHASVQERLSYLENILGDSAEKHEKHIQALEAQKSAHLKLSNELKAKDAHNAGLQDRLAAHERHVGETAEKHAQEVAGAHAKVDELSSKLGDERAAREAHAASIENLKKAHAGLVSDKAVRDQHHATLAERVDYLERTLGESADRHAREVEALKAAHAKASSDMKTRDGHHNAVVDKLGQLAREKDDVFAHHASLKERVDHLEQCLGECADENNKSVQAVKDAHAKHVKELDGLKKAQAHHATVQERLDYLERLLGDSADGHAQELQALHNKIDHVDTKVGQERVAREGHANAVGDQFRQDQRAKEQHHASMEERLKYIEGVIGDNADRHAKELEAHKATHAKIMGEVKGRDAHHATLSERLVALEDKMHDCLDKHAQEIAGAHTVVKQLHDRVAKEATSREAGHGAVREQLGKEKDARDRSHEALKDQLGNVEGKLSEHADNQAKELETHKFANQKLASELKGHAASHEAVARRVESLEKLHSDLASKHAQALELAHARLDQVHGRVESCEKQGAAIGELQKAHGSLASNKSSLDAHHSTLRERLDYIENLLGDSADQSRKAVESLRAEHSRLATDTRAHEARHVTVAERLSHLEKMLHDSVEKHAKELADAHAKADHAHNRIASCEAQGTTIDQLKKQQSSISQDRASRSGQDAATAERVDLLERVMQDTADKHGQEVQSAHAKVEQLHNRLADERQARDNHQRSISEHLAKEREHRERHTSSVEERLAYIESYLGESVDRHSKDLQNQQGSLQHRMKMLEQKHADELADLREHVHGERKMRAQHHDAVADHLENERRARDVHERAVQQHLASEKQARDTHERLIGEQLANERSVRDRHHEQVSEVIAREQESRERFHASEATRGGFATQGVHDALGQERKMREQQMQAHHDLAQQEQASRKRLEETVHRERSERVKHHESVVESLGALQRTVSNFDVLIKKEMEERTRENKRIWEAIDHHTHDLASQYLEAEAGRRVASPQHQAVAPAQQAPPFRCGSPQAMTAAVVAEPATFHMPPVAMHRSGTVGALPPAVSTVVAPPVMAASVPMAVPPVRSQVPTPLSLFDRMDTNHDGVVSRAEFNQMMGRQ